VTGRCVAVRHGSRAALHRLGSKKRRCSVKLRRGASTFSTTIRSLREPPAPVERFNEATRKR